MAPVLSCLKTTRNPSMPANETSSKPMGEMFGSADRRTRMSGTYHQGSLITDQRMRIRRCTVQSRPKDGDVAAVAVSGGDGGGGWRLAVTVALTLVVSGGGGGDGWRWRWRWRWRWAVGGNVGGCRWRRQWRWVVGGGRWADGGGGWRWRLAVAMALGGGRLAVTVALTRAPLGYFYNAPHWGGGLFRAPLWSPKLLDRF